MAKSPTPAEPEKLSRRQQFAQTYQMAKKSDPAIGAWVAGAFVVAALVGFGLFFLVTGRGGALGLGLSIVGGIMLGVLAALIMFSRRAQKAVYGQMEGQVGAAAGALGLLKRGWHVDQAIAFTKQQDVVHRVIGPPASCSWARATRAGSDAARQRAPAPRARRHRRAGHRDHRRQRRGPGAAGQALASRAEDEAPGAARRHHRHPGPAQGDRRLAAPGPMPKGPVPTSMKGLRGDMRGR